MTKARRITGWILALVVLTTQVFSGGITGKMVVEAAETNLITGGDFEETWVSANGDSVWKVVTWPDIDTLSAKEDNKHTGKKSLNFYDADGVDEFLSYQTLPNLEAGTYTFTMYVYGGSGEVYGYFDGEKTDEALSMDGAGDGFVEVTKDFTLTETKNVTVGFTIKLSAGGWGYIDDISLVKLEQQGVEEEEGYQITITPSQPSVEVGNQITLTAKVTNNGTEITDLESAGMQLFWWDNTNGSADWFVDYDDKNAYSLTLKINPQRAGTFEIQADLQDSGWQSLVKQKCKITVTEEVDTSTAVTGELNVTKVNGLSEDFIMGMDISSVISLFDSGVTYKDWNGKTINNVTDFCKFLASNGITHIRVRVWNNPYDASGRGYGGGNNDVAKAKKIADACEAAGIHMLVDFHCSDLWTDPGKQQAPKAWKGYTLEQKKTALQEFISTSLNTIDPNKNTVDMVQVGNETTGGFIEETDISDMCKLFSSGSAGVKAFNSSTKVVIHVESPQKGSVTTWAKNLDDNSVNYDIIATSYYPYWHGTLGNLKNEFQTVKDTYDKDVMVAETSYAYTLKDSDGHSNTVRKGNNDTGGNTTEPFTVQGQATSIRNLINTVNEVGGLGVFYWEPAWLTVGDTTGLTGAAYDRQVAANKVQWETYGSGWASSYASEYDPDDAGKWYGGSAVDNEAMFYPDGTPTAGLRVWEYVKTGAISNVVSVDDITNSEEVIFQGESYTLPATVSVAYNTGTIEDPVTWAASASEKIDAEAAGTTYIVSGTVHFSKTVTGGQYKGKTSAPVTYTLKVKPKNLITDTGAAGFESADAETKYTVDAAENPYNENKRIIDNLHSSDTPYAGSYCMHWTNYQNPGTAEGAVTCNEVITLEAGSYIFEAKAQGYAGDIVSVQILDTDNQVLYAGEDMVLDGWNNWKTPAVSFTLTETTDVKVRVVVKMQADGWGSADELFLHGSAVDDNVVYINDDSSSGPSSDSPSTSSSSSGSSGSSGTSATTVTKNPDGTTTTTTVNAAVNSAGNNIEVTTSVNKAENGSVIGTEEVTVIKNPAKDTSVVVSVQKDADGTVKEAVADVTKIGTVSAKDTKVTVSAAVTAQIKEAAGTEAVMITTTVTDSRGEEKYTVTVNSKDLVTGEKLEVVAVDKKTGEYVLVNAKTCKVNEKGNVTVKLPDGKEYVLLNSTDAKKVSDDILKTVKVKKSSKTVKAGKKTTIQLSDKLNMDNVKKITYTSSDKKVATVDKNGKVKTKKKGTVTIKAKVTLNNGKTKTVTMKVKVK